MFCIDANIVLRYLLEDHAELSSKAKKLIGENIVETPIEVLCEVVFVLMRVYGITRKDIADALLDFYDNTNCFLQHREAVIRGIEYFGKEPLDFVDCILAGYYDAENITIQTFDTKLEKLLSTISKTKNQT
jgi:predicted nucleic-acid-binding protein